MKQVYFSHSYRDVSINAYFLDYFVDRDISLCADQKSDTWCVAKLERYLRKSAGFVSIIPRRAAADGDLPYSPYIAHELTLARRCRVPRAPSRSAMRVSSSSSAPTTRVAPTSLRSAANVSTLVSSDSLSSPTTRSMMMTVPPTS